MATIAPTSHYLIGSNYGFNIPANASIQGITVSINRQASAAGLTDLVVSLVKATNVLVGNNLASATAWPITPLTVATYGSTTNNWGANLTPADVNNIGFGVALSVTNPVAFTANTATVDVMQIPESDGYLVQPATVAMHDIDRGHDHARRAIAALQAMVVTKWAFASDAVGRPLRSFDGHDVARH